MLRQGQIPALAVSPGAVTATGTYAIPAPPVNDFESMIAGLEVTAASGTSPTLDLYLQALGPDGNYYDMYHWAQQTGTTTANTQLFVGLDVSANRLIGSVGSKTVSANTLGVPILSNTWQLAYTIGGTSPSFTFTVNLYFPNTDRPN